MSHRLRVLSCLAVPLVAVLGLVAVPAAGAEPAPGAASVVSPPAGPAAGTLIPVGPQRVLDTRDGGRTLSSGTTQVVDLSEVLPPGQASSVLLTVTVTDTSAAGYVTAFPTGTTRPLASTLNFVAGRTVANQALVPIGSGTSVSLYLGGAGAASLVVDIRGYQRDGNAIVPGAVVPVQPTRLLDTRDPVNGYYHPVDKRGVYVPVSGRAGIPTAGVSAVIVNLTVVDPTADGYLAVGQSGLPPAPTSNVNYRVGQTVANLAVASLPYPWQNSGFMVYAGPTGTADVVVDVTGYVVAGSATASGALSPVSPDRLYDTRSGGLGGTDGAVPAGASRRIELYDAQAGKALTSSVGALVVNVTATNVVGAGYLTTYAGTELRPLASDLNVTPGVDASALTTVRLASDGSFEVYNGTSGPVDLVVDIFAQFPLVLAGDSAEDATSYQQDAAHDGASATVLATGMTRRWSRDLGGQVSYPVVADGAAFAVAATATGDHHSTLWAVDLMTGAVRFGPVTLPVGEDVVPSTGLTYAGGRVFVVAGGDLLAFDGRTGVRLWDTEIPYESQFSTPTAALGRVFLSGDGFGLVTYAFDQASGRLDWSVRGEAGASTPAVDPTGVYGSYAGYVLRFNLSGNEVYRAGARVAAGITVLLDGLVWAGDGMTVRASDGAAQRTFSSLTPPVAAGSRVLLLHDTDGQTSLRSETATSAAASWSQSADGGLVTAPVVSGTTAYLGSTSGTVFGVDTGTGQVVWQGAAGASFTPGQVLGSATDGVSNGLAAGDGALVAAASQGLVGFF